MAKNLLQHFGSVEKVMLASREELMKVGLVGPKTADRIKEVVSGEYKRLFKNRGYQKLWCWEGYHEIFEN